MGKSTKKPRKMTTNQALEALLGKKAAKRLRQLATQLAEADEDAGKKEKKEKKRTKR